MNFTGILIIAIAIHAGLTFSDLWLVNLLEPDREDYGAASFLPTGGSDSDHVYNRAVRILRPLDAEGNIVGIQGPPSGGILNLMQWAFKTPVCGLSSVISILLGYATFSYNTLDIIPSDGWGGWVKTAIYLIGTFITLATIFMVVQMVISTGIMQSPTMMAGVGIISVISIGSAALVRVGAVQCPAFGF